MGWDDEYLGVFVVDRSVGECGIDCGESVAEFVGYSDTGLRWGWAREDSRASQGPVRMPWVRSDADRASSSARVCRLVASRYRRARSMLVAVANSCSFVAVGV